MFNKNMAYEEAQSLLFRSAAGKSKEEILKMKKEYDAVLPSIIHRELEAGKNCLTEYKI